MINEEGPVLLFYTYYIYIFNVGRYLHFMIGVGHKCLGPVKYDLENCIIISPTTRFVNL